MALIGSEPTMFYPQREQFKELFQLSCLSGGFTVNTRTSGYRSLIKNLLLSIVCSFLVSGLSLRAQTDTGRVTGIVTDPTGAVVPDTTVKLTNADTGATQIISAGSHGNFTFSAVPRGNYKGREASHACFQSVNQTFVLQVSQVQTVEFKMPVGASSETVEVNDAAPVVDLDFFHWGGGRRQAGHRPSAEWAQLYPLANLIPASHAAGLQ